MGEIVNLRRFKKRLARDAAGHAAAIVRLQHGRTKAELNGTAQAIRKQDRTLDGAKLIRSPGDGEPLE